MLQFCGKTNTLGTVPNVAVFGKTVDSLTEIAYFYRTIRITVIVMRFLFQSVCIKRTSLLAFFLLFCCTAVTAKVFDKSRLSWRAGVSWSLTNYIDNSYERGLEESLLYYRDYTVSLSERYGSYRGSLYSMPPLSADIDYRVLKFLDLSAGLTWVCMWGTVYNSWNSDWMDAENVTSNSFYLIPSVKINYKNTDRFTLYSKIGYGLGVHFNRSDSNIAGLDIFGSHNDYLLDKGKNSISGQLEVVVLGARFKRYYYEFGFGSRYLGYGSRLGVEFKF